MTASIWQTLLSTVRQAHRVHCELSAFCEFPDDIFPQEVEPFHIPAADLLRQEAGLADSLYMDLREAIIAAGPHAHWRETYKDTDIGEDFLSRFGCYCVVGDGGPFYSRQIRAWIVYMPPNLHYRWHHHVGEEMYLVVAGEAEFFRKGDPPETLKSGQTSEHKQNQPHAMETHDHPVLALVIWRNGFESPPMLTLPEDLQ
ncbi:MAG: dimethylsulfonioproprionate lyase family protein [Boseongicola sp.]